MTDRTERVIQLSAQITSLRATLADRQRELAALLKAAPANRPPAPKKARKAKPVRRKPAKPAAPPLTAADVYDVMVVGARTFSELRMALPFRSPGAIGGAITQLLKQGRIKKVGPRAYDLVRSPATPPPVPETVEFHVGGNAV